MKYIDLNTWNRKKHFELYRSMDYPHLNLCANVDITQFHKKIKDQQLSIFQAFLFGVVKTANEIKEFRYRIREDSVIEHEIVHPSFTINSSNDLFTFCSTTFEDDFTKFNYAIKLKIQQTEQEVNLKDEEGIDNLFYMTCIPWVSFTSILHPVHLTPADSIPRFAWGKFYKENEMVKMPLSVQAHHALVDGIHIGQFYTELQKWLDDPRNYSL